MKKTILFSALALFTSIGANALTWTGAEDLSSINAQIVDAGTTDYVLSPVDPLNPINGTGVQINGTSMGLINSFTFPADDGTNSYSINGATPALSYMGLIDFNAVEINDVILLGDLINPATRGHGVYIHDGSVIHNDLIVGGEINANYYGIRLYGSSTGSFTSTANITSSYGINLYDTTTAGAVNISGTINSTNQGIYMVNNLSMDSFTSTADVTSTNSIGIGLSSVAIAGAVDISGTINSYGQGFYMKGSAGSFTSTADITGGTSNYGIYLDGADIAGAIDISGEVTNTGSSSIYIKNSSAASFTSTALSNGMVLSYVTITGAANISNATSRISLSNTSADSLTLTGVNITDTSGISLSYTTIAGAVDISGTIDSASYGISASNNSSADSFTSTADITAGSYGMYVASYIANGVNVSGTINAFSYGAYMNSFNSVVSTADITSSDNYGLYLTGASATGALVNNGSITSDTMAAIAGDTGSNTLNYAGTGTLSGATYTIDMQGGTDTVNLSATTLADLSINSAETVNVAADAIIGGTGMAVSGVSVQSITNDGNIAGITTDGNNNTLTYAGTGVLSGAIYDIDMGAGSDVLIMDNVNIWAPKINGTERINITNSVLELDLTDANKSSVLMTMDGTTTLSLLSVAFDMNSTATLADGDQLILASADDIDATYLNTLIMNLAGFDGTFSIVDNAGTDELTFTLGDVVIPPVAPPSAATALSDTFVSSGAVATQISSASDGMVKGRMDKLQGKRLEFASLYSDSMYQIHEEARGQVWVQGFGLSGAYEGDVAKGLNAYDTTLSGIVMGYDYNWGLMRTGVAYTYTGGKVEGEGNVFDIDVESFSGSLYGVMDFDNVYIETAASFGTTTFDQNLGGTLSSYDSTDMGGLMRVGLKLHVGHFGLEQYVGFQYKNVIVEEHNNGVDTVAEYNQEMFKGELGFVTSYQMLLASGDAIVPYLRLETGRDFADNATLTSLDNSGAAVGSLETVDLGDWVSRIATGVSFLTQGNYSISGEYEYEFRDKYQAHIGKIKGRLMF